MLNQVFTDNEERPGEKRIYSMVFDNKHDRLITGKIKFQLIDSSKYKTMLQDQNKKSSILGCSYLITQYVTKAKLIVYYL